MSEKPRIPLEELLREAVLTADYYLIVKGPTDQAFYREWLLRRVTGVNRARVVVEAVNNIEIDPDWVDELGLPHGARSYVVAVARQAAEGKAKVRCIADRDCGHHVADHQLNELWWTDFPALESHVFDADGLDTVNRTVLGGRLPSGAELVADLAPVLRELYTVRAHNESLPRPDIAKGFDKSKKMTSFDVTKTVPPAVAAQCEGYIRPSASDPREYAYGHDIADLLLCLYGNEIKTRAKVPHRDALESYFRLCMLLNEGFNSSKLAENLRKWLAL